jgi:hypothetical protein
VARKAVASYWCHWYTKKNTRVLQKIDGVVGLFAGTNIHHANLSEEWFLRQPQFYATHTFSVANSINQPWLYYFI